MKNIKHITSLVVQVAAFVLVTLGLASIFRTINDQASVNATAPVETQTPSGYPPPQTDTPPPPQTATVEPYPPPGTTLPPPATATIALTTIPPTGTPLPTQEPPTNAEGFITYLVRDGDNIVIYLLNTDADGNPDSRPTQVTLPVQQPWAYGTSAIPSPNGRRFALLQFFESGNVVSIYDIDTSQVMPLFKPNLPSGIGDFIGWHPDNQHVLYRVDGGHADRGLWLVNIDRGTSVILANQNLLSPSRVAGSIYYGDISPDGQKVIYTLYKNTAPLPSSELWLVDANGSNPQLLYTSTAILLYPRWSPDGSRIAFVGQDGLTVIMADGSNPQSLSQNIVTAEYLYQPAWSPDSRTIAFVAFDGLNPLSSLGTVTPSGWEADAFIGANIHLVDVITGEERALLTDTGNIDPVWSPDGSQIAFASNRNGATEIWAVHVDGSNLRQLTTAGQYIRFPLWHRR